jgi:hypothetical protein
VHEESVVEMEVGLVMISVKFVVIVLFIGWFVVLLIPNADHGQYSKIMELVK